MITRNYRSRKIQILLIPVMLLFSLTETGGNDRAPIVTVPTN